MVVEILADLTRNAVNFLPNIISAVILLVIGLIVGKIVGRVAKEVLQRVKLDYYVSETKKPVYSLADIFSLVVRWWIYLAFITAALSREVLGITYLATWVAEINAFIPRIIGASVILVVAFVMAEYIKGHIKKTNTLWSTVVGKVLFFFVMYVAIAISLPILGVSSTLVDNILLVIIGAVGLGTAIALGLGLKDAVSEISKKYVRKIRV
ncbi:MAG: hypothetical protein HYW27_01190 [Candidatus Aenigmarchaeota archaeon]|nr:hypothetical protein [Candidatus Aenigmarchaeota archaeon]